MAVHHVANTDKIAQYNQVMTMMTREQFYKSTKWESFRKLIIQQRTDQDGFIHCAECGKPILQKYDLIVHHKQELSEANVNDAAVALNPDNVQCVCFRCHNKIHDRYTAGHAATYTGVQKQVYIVYGAPCSGKTTWVRSVADPQDLVVDMDSIWQMVSINDRYDKPKELRSVVFDVRDKLYDIIKYRSGRWHNAYVITGGALKGDRDRLQARIGADDLVFIDTPQDVCIERSLNRKMSIDAMADWARYIDDWFSQYQSD